MDLQGLFSSADVTTEKERKGSFAWNLFRIFCCPPCPKQITEKLVFIPPFPPHYELDLIDEANHAYEFVISPDVDTSGLMNIIQQEARFVKTSLSNNIAVLYIKCTDEKKYTIIYSHGNADDLGRIHKFCTNLCLSLFCDVVVYDYSGYGQSKGRASERNLYSDIKAVWDYTLKTYESDGRKIVLYGKSLGTAPTIDLAAKVVCAGVILQTPFTSSLGVICHSKTISRCFDRFLK